jgi:3-oxoacyl-[acyl-carrier-protein] synthase II
LEKAIRKALASAGMEPSDIGYVNAHGTGTPFNDGAEARAFRRVFGADSSMRLSSTKAALGHTLGAAGAIEGLLCLLALESGCIPPQINLLEPEPDVAEFLAGKDERKGIRTSMSVNLGFGGSNAAVLFSKI